MAIVDVKIIQRGMLSEPLSVKATDAADSVSETELIERAKTDSEAFGQLFEAYYGRILTYTYRCTLNLAVAEDLTSNTFFKALRSIRKYRPRGSFSAWLYRIASNEVRMHWRSEKRRRATSRAPAFFQDLACTYFESPAIETEEDRQEKMRAYARLHDVLRQLPYRYRSVIMLRFFEDLPYKVIADVLGKRVGTLKSLVHRALQRLKPILKKDATLRETRHFEE